MGRAPAENIRDRPAVPGARVATMSDSEDEKNDSAAPAPAAEGGEQKRVAKKAAEAEAAAPTRKRPRT